MHVARTRIVGPCRTIAVLWFMTAGLLGLTRPAGAQSTDEAEAPLFTPEELEELVAPIALYPDDLVAIVLPASTYPLDVVEAARFLDEVADDGNRTPDEDWDDSVVALLNYPEVVRLMDEDLDWTWDLGEAFLNQQAEVFDAIQRFRAQAREAGNLASDERQLVTDEGSAIRIEPADPQVIYVPYYEPRKVIVHHHAPIRYYPRPYPVYYYPYPAGHSFWSGYFWGVTTAFVIGWNTHHLHAHHHLHIGHPYRHHYYYDPFYVRRSVSINIVNVDRDVYVWQPRHHRIGGRPGRVTVTREGVVRADYGTRRYVSAGDTTRRTVTTRSHNGRSVVTTSERQDVATSRARSTAGAASSERRTTGRSAQSMSSRDTDAGSRVTTREGIVSALREAGDRNAAASPRSSGAPTAERSSRPSTTRQPTRSSPSERSSTRSSTSERSSTRLTSPDRSSTRSNLSAPSLRAAPPRESQQSSSRSLGSTSRSAQSTSRSSTSRSTSSNRSATGAYRSTPSTSRNTPSTSRSTPSTTRGTISSSSGAAGPSRSVAPSRATSTRSPSQASRSAGSPSRSAASARSGGPTRSSGIGTTRTTR